MAHPDQSFHRTATPSSVPGSKTSAKQLLAAVLRYANARGRLAALEAKIAWTEMKTGLVLMGAAAVALAAAFAVITAGLVLLLIQWLPQGNGAAACGVVAGIMILAALVMLRLGRKALGAQNFFPVTRAEIQIDQQCLKNH
jgi:hypothetical protein